MRATILTLSFNLKWAYKYIVDRNQRTFDFIVQHLRRQKARSIDIMHSSDGPQEILRYVSLSGRKSPIGFLIPHEQYSKELESQTPSIFGTNTLTAILKSKLRNILLTIRLERIHNQFPVSRWESEFEKVAKAFELVYCKPV